MSKILTIAIPSYNMEKFLSRCLDSVLVPEILDVLEVLVINDGSKDQTLEIAKEYESKFPHSVQVIDKPNGGWGSAINVAIPQATGKYFKILDADDWFESKALVEFVSLASQVDVDLLASSFTYIYEDVPNREDVYPEMMCNKVWSFTEYLDFVHYKKHLPMATIAYRTGLLQENKITLCDKYYADIDYHLIPLIYVKTIYFTMINLYRYFIGRFGQSTSLTGYIAHKEDYMNLAKKLVVFYHHHRNTMELNVRKTYELNCCKVIHFLYRLYFSPMFNKNYNDTLPLLRQFDDFLKHTSPLLYKQTGRHRVRGFIPYIFIWRKFNINLLALRKWM